MEAAARAVVDRPIEDVWTHVSTVENMGEWVDGVSRYEVGDLDVGSRF